MYMIPDHDITGRAKILFQLLFHMSEPGTEG